MPDRFSASGHSPATARYSYSMYRWRKKNRKDSARRTVKRLEYSEKQQLLLAEVDRKLNQLSSVRSGLQTRAGILIGASGVSTWASLDGISSCLVGLALVLLALSVLSGIYVLTPYRSRDIDLQRIYDVQLRDLDLKAFRAHVILAKMGALRTSIRRLDRRQYALIGGFIFLGASILVTFWGRILGS